MEVGREQREQRSREMKLKGCKMEVDKEQRVQTKQRNEILRMQNGGGHGAKGTKEANI
jgi:hypothetical protein